MHTETQRHKQGTHTHKQGTHTHTHMHRGMSGTEESGPPPLLC